ncbi:girdin-like [Argonauta hians]
MFLTKFQGCVCCHSVQDKETDEACSDKKDWTIITNNFALEKEHVRNVSIGDCKENICTKQPSGKEVLENFTQEKQSSENQGKLNKLLEPNQPLKSINSSVENRLQETVEDARLVGSVQSEQEIRSKELYKEFNVSSFSVGKDKIKKILPSVKEEDTEEIAELEECSTAEEYSTANLKDQFLETGSPLLVADANSDGFSDHQTEQSDESIEYSTENIQDKLLEVELLISESNERIDSLSLDNKSFLSITTLDTLSEQPGESLEYSTENIQDKVLEVELLISESNERIDSLSLDNKSFLSITTLDTLSEHQSELPGESLEYSTENLKDKNLEVKLLISESSERIYSPSSDIEISVTDATSGTPSELNQSMSFNQEINSEITDSLPKMSTKPLDNEITCIEDKQNMENNSAFLNLDDLKDNSEKAKVDSAEESKIESNDANIHLPCDDIEKPVSSLNACINLISDLDQTLINKREESPASDELIDTLAYEPDIDDAVDDHDENLETVTSSLEGVLSKEASPDVEIKKDCGEILNEIESNNTETKPATEALPDSILSMPETLKDTNAPSKEEEKTANNSSIIKKKNKKNKSTENDSVGNESVDHQNTVAVKSEKPKENYSKSHSSKKQKKEDKPADHVLRSLNNIATAEGKLSVLSQKYSALSDQNQTLITNHRVVERKLLVLSRQKDQLQLENNKSLMAKSRLESLCRELQKHNRIIKEESLARAKEEDEKRKEISTKFQTTINDIQAQMVDNHDRNMKLREENTELATKLKNFLEQYEQREKYFEKVAKHRELEQQLVDTKLKQAAMQLMEEREKNKKEKELMTLKAAESESKAVMLETQVQTYKDRYSEFQSTITKSNDMFSKLKGEMDKMSGKIKKLEKDSASWKNKWENCNKALIGMIDQKTSSDKERILLLTKIQKLESLCRAQQERLRAQKSPPPSEGTCQKCKNESILPPQNLDNDSTEQAANETETAVTKNTDSSETNLATDVKEATVEKDEVKDSSHSQSITETSDVSCSESSDTKQEASQQAETPDIENSSSEMEIESNAGNNISPGSNSVAEVVKPVETTTLVS